MYYTIRTILWYDTIYTIYTLYCTIHSIYDTLIRYKILYTRYDTYCTILPIIVVSIVRYAIHIVYKKFCIVKAYRKCSWIIQYIGVYRMNHIVSVNHTYHTIYRHVGLKWVFWLKFVILFYLNKLLDFANTKLLGNLIESNEIASPWVFFLPSLSPTKFRLYS